MYLARFATVPAVLLATLVTGCVAPRSAQTPQRYDRGLVLVLPGIEGTSVWSRDILRGLDEGQVNMALELHDWTVRLPGTFLINLTAYERNRRQAQRLADRIIRYREKYPGNPVHLVAHSGGGGVAILAVEALPAGRQIDSVILLAPALSPEHDLTPALLRTRRGVWNFYSSHDIGFLRVGTTLFGAIDRDFGPSAGAVGFRLPEEASEEQKRLHKRKLRQVAWDDSLKRFGASGSHLGWASRRFAREYLAGLIADSGPHNWTRETTEAEN